MVEEDEVHEAFADSEIAENNQSPIEEEKEEEREKQDHSLSSSLPVIRFDVPPQRTHHFFRQFRNSSNPNNFLKAVKWYAFLFHYVLFLRCYLLTFYL